MSVSRYTLAEHCSCGAAFLIDAEVHEHQWSDLRVDWIARHQACLKPAEETEDLSHRESDMGSSTGMSNDHHVPEMQIGFARQWALDEA